MNESPTPSSELPAAGGTANAVLLERLIVLANYKKRIVLIPLCGALLGAAASLAMPDMYLASAKLLPPQQAQSGAAALLSQLGGAAGLAGSVSGIKNPNELYVGMLRSRTVADSLIKRFDLMKVYGSNSLEETRRLLESKTTITSRKDGIIAIDVEDAGKTRVAPLANAYAEELLRLTKILAVTEASQRRMFFEQQLETAKDKLANAELTLKGSLNVRGVVNVDSESRAIAETVGRLRGQISAKEIQIGAMQAFVTSNNQDYKRAQEELSSLRTELSRLENGRPGSGHVASVPISQAGLENIKTLRDVKYYQMLYELLAKNFEAARLDEAKDTSMIQVLDSAIEPERKKKSGMLMMALMGGVFGLLLTGLWIYMAELKREVRQSPFRAAKWQELKSVLSLK